VDADERASLRANLARVADGNRTTLEPAFTRLHPLVLGSCRRILDGPTAEDAAQKALVNLSAHSGEYDAGRDPVPWALAFASNACRTARKRTIRRREQGDVPDLPAEAEPEGPPMDAQLRAAVQAKLATLCPLHAETLASAMGDRPSGATFRKRLERASARFREAWRLR
jgi:DNA-directed RNA polymerase specialized sigma24 family protein